jgi:DNA polymerase V
MDTIDQFVPELEHYSVDEAFVHFDSGNQEADAHQVKQTVQKWTGIPVSIGLGSTKVLAKVASHLAKKNPQYDGVVDLSGKNADDYLKEIDVRNLWGIGSRSEAFLKSTEQETMQLDLWEAAGLERLVRKQKIETALELKNCSDAWIKKHLTIRGLRLVWELRGISCLPLETFEKPKKGICCSRSFGQSVFTEGELGEALAMHAARGAEKLRRQRLAASHLTVFISTSHFKADADDMYSSSVSWQLPFPTAHTPALVESAQELLKRIYKPGFEYRKAGILLTDIVADNQRQQNILLPLEAKRHRQLLSTVDEINRRHGRHTVRPLAMGFDQSWQMKRSNISGRYTTRWNEVLKVQV